MCLIVVGGHFANFEQNSQQFFLGSILLQSSPWTSFVTFVKVFIENFFETFIDTITFLGIYWTSFVAFIIRITFIGTFLNLLRSWNTLKNTIKTKSVFSANLQFLMMSVNKKINGEVGKQNLLKKWFYFMLTNFTSSRFFLRWRILDNSEEFQFTFLLISFTIEVN